jgi:hypothetical protein
LVTQQRISASDASITAAKSAEFTSITWPNECKQWFYWMAESWQ